MTTLLRDTKARQHRARYQPDPAAAAALSLIYPRDPRAAKHRRDLLAAFAMECAIWECSRPHRSNGMCELHYHRHLAAIHRAAVMESRYPSKSAMTRKAVV